MSLEAVLACTTARWLPRLGDPSVMGWVTVACYAAAAFLCLLTALRRKGAGERPFWWGLALLMAALAFNKQLDLQSALTAAGRCVSQMQGWYDARRPVQLLFVVALLGVGGAGAVALFWRMRRHLAATWLALLGLCFVLTFVAVRAIGFHHIDLLINLRVQGIRMNWVLELTGIALIALNALWLLQRGRQRG